MPKLIKSANFSKKHLLGFILLFAIIGGYFIFRSFAVELLGTALPARLGQSVGTSYYVSGTSGNDANSGSITAPFKTIPKAWSVASAGTTIHLRAGTYSGHFYLNDKTASATPIPWSIKSPLPIFAAGWISMPVSQRAH